MSKNNYLFYSDYFKDRTIKNNSIMIAKTKNSYLIGPILNYDFYEKSFYKRVKSNSLYTTKIYKKMFRKKCDLLINKYKNNLKSNQIIEIDKKGEIIIHSILKVPGEDDEKE